MSSNQEVNVTYKAAQSKTILKWWYRRTALEKFLVISLMVAFILFLIFHAFLGTAYPIKQMLNSSDALSKLSSECAELKSETLKPICTTKGCALAATNLLLAMNTSVDPCVNFYEYACGQWNRDHPIPDDMHAYGTFMFARESLRQQMRILLESDALTNSRSIMAARIAYKTCMNVSQLESIKSRRLSEAIRSLGMWPLFDKENWTKTSLNFTALMANSRRYFGSETFFQVYVYADAKNTTENTLYIDQGILTLGRGSRDYYLNATMFSKHLEAFEIYQRSVIKLVLEDANINYVEEELEAQLAKILEFEKKLAHIIMPEDDRRNNTRMYNKRKISYLYSIMPQVEWINLFHEIAPDSLRHLINNDTVVIVSEIEYMKKASELLNSTDMHVISNYVFWRILYPWAKTLDSRFEDIRLQFLQVMIGQQSKSPRWKECAQGPTNLVPLAAGALYVREHFDSNDKMEALEMIANLREAFKEIVSESDWMDNETKRVAIEKAENMINNIGYPDFINNDTELDKHYDNLNLDESDSYFELLQKVNMWAQWKEFKRLTKKFDKYEFEISPAVVNAFYSPEKNAITFPAGILKPPFFSGIFPKMVNYGAMGAVIGHEITHGFDDQGSQFDKNGNLQNWWSDNSYKDFASRKECVIDQYNSYYIPNTGLNVNGKLTQGENIADNGGIKEAYRAYKKYIEKRNEDEPRLPGLQDFSNEQIFFLSYAHFWCGHKKDAAAIHQALTDEHSPEKFRVIGVLSNFDEFSKAFSCPAGSPLNPSKRCAVW